ncbi:MAG: GntR family transcriptional regulator [Bacteroidales bacterium]|nr:GntR family transcriptional regulator [Bacteroidales bacterium]
MEFKDNKPIYMQIASRICDEILTHTYKVDERIPSVREYAANLEVNTNTVVRSFDYLQNNNIIYNKRGMGFYVSADAEKIIMDIRKSAFVNDVLPEVFEEMRMLGISIDEIVQLWNK